MGFLTFWCPYVLVWFIQKPEYPTIFRRTFDAWAIFWCGCAVLFFVVQFVTAISPDKLRPSGSEFVHAA